MNAAIFYDMCALTGWALHGVSPRSSIMGMIQDTTPSLLLQHYQATRESVDERAKS
jgi:hypothetical protein